MDEELDWVPVSQRGKCIGAIGFVGSTIVAIYSEFAPRDFNRDGKVGIGEWVTGLISPVGVDMLAFVEVAQAARIEEAVYTRGDVESIANRLALNFFGNAIVDGAFAAWLSYSVKRSSAALAPLLGKDAAKRIIFRKGMETTVKKIWQQSLHQNLPSDMPTLKAKR